MADITWPGPAFGFAPESHDEGVRHDVELTLARNGSIYTSSLPGMRWVGTLQFPAESVSHLIYRRQLEALLFRLRGGANRLLLWNLLTPAPLGTLRGTPTFSATVAQGATTATLAGCTPGATLLRGDRLGLGAGGQRVMIVQDAVADGSGNMPITFEGFARVAVSSGALAVWDKPKTRFYASVPELYFPATATTLPAISVPLIEDWQA